MPLRTLTSANSVLTLNIPGVFPIPVGIEGYAADDAFAVEAFDLAEAVMGVDGKMSAGYTPNVKKLTVTLQADSPSVEVFDAWRQAIESAREVFFSEITITIPSVGKTYNLRKAILSNAMSLPPAKKILQPLPYVISFESVDVALIS